MKRKRTYCIGIDEAGRGPLAGPLSLGVCVVPMTYSFKLFRNLKDSKKLTETKRELFFKIMNEEKKKGNLDFAVGFASEKIIDNKGLTFAVKKAMKEALQKLHVSPDDCEVFLDGGLKAPEEYISQQTIIKGDEKIPVISLASIVAKVLRDKKMKALGKKYPAYGFEVHKGYATKSHREAILQFGVLPTHRKLFLRKLMKDTI